MSEVSLDVFKRTLQKTDIWLKEVMSELNTQDRHLAYSSLRAVLHALRDRLPTEVAAHFSDQLPMLIRGFYFEGWRPALAPIKIKDSQEFFQHVAECGSGNAYIEQNSEEVSRAVFRVIHNQLGIEIIEKICSILPHNIQDLLLESVGAKS